MRSYLFNTEKIKYIRGQKPEVECILCAIRDRNPDVKSLELYRDTKASVSLNLYPYNTGHLMVYPLRHIEDITEMTREEALSIHELTSMSIRILTEEFSPDGYNLGYNLGYPAGGSIAHIHQHVVPRYRNEVGFIDVLSGEWLVVVDPLEVMERLTLRFGNNR